MNVNDVKTKGMKYFILFKGAQKDSRAKDKCHRRSKYICMNKIEQFGFLMIERIILINHYIVINIAVMITSKRGHG